MPIKQENKKLYPKEWPQISKHIREVRAKNLCEECGIRNYSVGFRDAHGRFHPAAGSVKLALAGAGLNHVTLELNKFKDARDIVRSLNEKKEPHYFVIVLTVAHKDHDPANCDHENLAAWCQKCHNSYDAQHRADTRKHRVTKQLKIKFYESN